MSRVLALRSVVIVVVGLFVLAACAPRTGSSSGGVPIAPEGTALLLEEGQTLRAERGDFRKLLVAALYARRWLAPAPPGAPPFAWRALERLESLVDWRPVGADALAGDAAVHC